MPYYGSAIGGLMEGFGQGLTYAQRLRLMQQQQQDRERMMAAQEQAGNLIAQQYARPPVQQQAPVPAPPQPGPPPGVSPTPAPIGGQVPTQPPGAPMPRTAPMGPQGPAPIPPYQPMPTGVAPQQPQEAVPPPPQHPQMTFENVASGLVAQGLKGRQLFDALQQITPMMGMEYKQQIAELQNQMKMYDIQLRGRREERLGEEGAVRTQQAQQRLDLMSERLKSYQKSVDQNAAEALTPGGVKVAEELVSAGKPLPGGWGMKGMSRGNAILNAMARSEEGGAGSGAVVAGQAEYKSLERALTTRQNFVAAGNQFVRNMNSQISLVNKYMQAGTATGVPALNRWIQSGRKAIAGDPDVSALDTAIRGLAREHQRIVTGVTSNAQLHVAAQQTADELLNVAQTPEQIKAVLKVMSEEAANAMKAGQDEIESIKTQMRSRGKKTEALAEPEIKTAVEQSGQKYEPDKYEYRIMDGQVQRRPKRGK